MTDSRTVTGMGVFGTRRWPSHFVSRTDRSGRPLSVGSPDPKDSRKPDYTRRSVLFTGAPGSGKTVELDRAANLAQRQGWPCVRSAASATEPLEVRFISGVRENLGQIRRKLGIRAWWRARKTVRALRARGKNPSQNGAELRLGIAPIQVIGKRQWDAKAREELKATALQLVDDLSDASSKRKLPLMLVVDKLDTADDLDLVMMAEMSERLQEKDQAVYLITAGGEMTPTRLVAATGARSGAGISAARQFDTRPCDPLTVAQSHELVTKPLEQNRIAYQADAVDHLLKAANGNPGRLRDLAERAVEVAGPNGITADVARAAVKEIETGAQIVHQAAWNACSGTEKELLAKVAAQGPSGLSMPGVGGLDRWKELDEARYGLVVKGLIQEGDGEIVTAPDPSLRDWVVTRVGHDIAQKGLAPASQAPTIAPAATAAGAEAGDRQPTTRSAGNATYSMDSR